MPNPPMNLSLEQQNVLLQIDAHQLRTANGALRQANRALLAETDRLNAQLQQQRQDGMQWMEHLVDESNQLSMANQTLQNMNSTLVEQLTSALDQIEVFQRENAQLQMNVLYQSQLNTALQTTVVADNTSLRQTQQENSAIIIELTNQSYAKDAELAVLRAETQAKDAELAALRAQVQQLQTQQAIFSATASESSLSSTMVSPAEADAMLREQFPSQTQTKTPLLFAFSQLPSNPVNDGDKFELEGLGAPPSSPMAAM